MALNTSYGSRPGAAAYALPDARAEFIRRTYAHLAGAILAFVVLEYALLSLPGIENLAGLMTSGYNWLIVIVLFMVASGIADRWARSDASRGVQYTGLALYVVAQAVFFVPLMLVATRYSDPTVLPAAAVITAFLFVGLSLVVFVTRADFSFLRGALAVGFLVALGLILASFLFGFSLGVFFAVAMVGLAAGAILYSTSNVLHYYGTGQYVAASLSLFAAVALLFYNVMRILVALRR